VRTFLLEFISFLVYLYAKQIIKEYQSDVCKIIQMEVSKSLMKKQLSFLMIISTRM